MNGGLANNNGGGGGDLSEGGGNMVPGYTPPPTPGAFVFGVDPLTSYSLPSFAFGLSETLFSSPLIFTPTPTIPPPPQTIPIPQPRNTTTTQYHRHDVLLPLPPRHEQARELLREDRVRADEQLPQLPRRDYQLGQDRLPRIPGGW